MITFETIEQLELATLKEGDLVQVLGEFSEGDVALMTGKVYPALHDSSNRLVTIANGLKVEIFPTPLGDKDVTKKYVNQQDNKIKQQINDLSFATVFDTVADMKLATDLKVGQLVQTKGYYTVGDGGGGSYLVTAGNTGDGFGNFNVGNNTLTLQYDNRTIFGATYGLGTGDDTARLIAARYNVLSTYGTGTVDISSFGNITLVTPEAEGYMFRIWPRFTLKGNSVGSWATATRINLEPITPISIGMNISDAPDLTVEPKRQDGGSLKGVWVATNEKVDVGCYFGTAGTSENTDLTISGTVKHGMIVVRSWYTKFRNIKVRDCLGAGITIGKHPDLTFNTSDSDAVNACDFYNLDVSLCGKNDMFRLNSNENTGYGVGFYGSIGGSTVRNITAEGNYGAGIVDASAVGSYLLDGVYLERNNQTGTDRNAYQILTISNDKGQAAKRVWNNVWLTYAGGVNGKTLVRDSIHEYVFDLNGSGARPEFLGDNARLSGNSRSTYSSYDAKGKVFRTIHTQAANLNSLGGGLSKFVSANASTYFLYFIPEETTTSSDAVQCRPKVNNAYVGNARVIKGGFTAYEPILFYSFSMDKNQICQVLFPDSYQESCAGMFVIQEGRISNEMR